MRRFIVEATSSEHDEREDSKSRAGSKARVGAKRDIPEVQREQKSKDKRDTPDGLKEKPAAKQPPKRKK